MSDYNSVNDPKYINDLTLADAIIKVNDKHGGALRKLKDDGNDGLKELKDSGQRREFGTGAVRGGAEEQAARFR